MKYMMRMPQVIAHCCMLMSLPRLDGGEISEMYTGTWAEQIPTQKPLIIRPTINMGIFCAAQQRMEPIILGDVNMSVNLLWEHPVVCQDYKLTRSHSQFEWQPCVQICQIAIRRTESLARSHQALPQ